MKKLCQLSLLLACLALVCLIQGCAVYSTASDERLVDTMGSDNAISGLIKKDLMAERFADNLSGRLEVLRQWAEAAQ